MLKHVDAGTSALVKAGKSGEEVIGARPLAEIGKTWGNGFMKTNVFTGIVFDTMSAR